MKKLALTFIASTFFLISIAQVNKKPLDHSDYDGWKSIKNQAISESGDWVSYEVNPQKGDGYLYLYQKSTEKLDSFPRGYDAKFSPKSESLIFKIKPQFDTIRQARLKKVRPTDLPKDSLAILNLSNKKIEKFAEIKSHQIPTEGGEWIAFLLKTKKNEVVQDSTKAEEKTEKKPQRKPRRGAKLDVGDLNFMNLSTFETISFANVSDYSISKNGEIASFITQIEDSVNTSSVSIFNFNDKTSQVIFKENGLAKKLETSVSGDKLAFTFSADTTEQKLFNLYYFESKFKQAKLILDTLNSDITEGWVLKENAAISFSKNGEHIYFGIAPKPEKEIKDSLLPDERYSVDIWSWKDPLLQTEQKVRLKSELTKSYRTVYNTKKKTINPLTNPEVPNIKLFDNGNANWALGYSSIPYEQEMSWDTGFRDCYLINVNTGKSEQILTKMNSMVDISPSQKYVYWYETADSTWNIYNISTKNTRKITSDIPYSFYSETHDMPCDPSPYGIMGWTKDDKYILIQDKYDIWKVDPKGNEKPSNITQGLGREEKISFSYIKLDNEEKFIDLNKEILLKAFGELNKKSGFYRITNNKKPQKICFDDAMYLTPIKAKNSDLILWRKSTFVDYPNLWLSDMNFSNAKQISDANPQQKNFLWGSVELVDWISGDGEKLQGMLYKPENFDPNKKYPMLVYFYERLSDLIHNYYTPQPSASTISPSYCVSNDYLVFMPDITYPKTGHPGENAYSAIVSGTLAMMDRFDYVDKENVALQGQSWGGYQITHLITKTDLYKCAMAGAPVSNMTSAYGAIRWQSGRSRMFQYEQTQSRIGGTLWDKPLHYIENSPIFSVPKVKTPLLIMHNTNDGAVPWYQGIEFFVAMRRLQKPCWMLSYNNEKHNLDKRPNRMDLSIRMMQFFDHYLKGKAAPAWMVDGIPAIKKGKYDGYELKE